MCLRRRASVSRASVCVGGTCVFVRLCVTAAPADAPADVACKGSLIELLQNEDLWESASRDSEGLGWCDCVVDRETGSTPLHEIASRAAPSSAQFATSGAKPGVVAALVQKFVKGGARVLAPNAQNATALHIAASRGVSAVAVSLCGAAAGRGQLDALLGAVNAQNLTALSVASAHGHLVVARILLDRGASLSVSANAGGVVCPRAFTDAVIYAAPEHLLEAIVSQPAASPDCLVQDMPEGKTLLHYAASAADLSSSGAVTEVINVLLDFGANASRRDELEEVPLMAAVRVDQAAVASLLLAIAPESVSFRNGHGSTPLHIAAARGAIACARLLLNAGSPVDVQDNLGFTALQMAERSGHSDIASLIRMAIEDPVGYYASRRDPTARANYSQHFLQGRASPNSVDRTAKRAEESASVGRTMDSASDVKPLTILIVFSVASLGLASLIAIGFAAYRSRSLQSSSTALVAIPNTLLQRSIDGSLTKVATLTMAEEVGKEDLKVDAERTADTTLAGARWRCSEDEPSPPSASMTSLPGKIGGGSGSQIDHAVVVVARSSTCPPTLNA